MEIADKQHRQDQMRFQDHCRWNVPIHAFLGTYRKASSRVKENADS